MAKKLRIVTIGAVLFCAAALMLTGCKPAVTAAQDTTAPKEVTELNVIGGNGKVSVSWKNPADKDLYQVKISVAKTEDPTAVKSVYIDAEAGKEGGTIVEDLEADTDYTVTVVTVDKLGNKSSGASKSGKTKSVVSITLGQDPKKELKTNGKVTVTIDSSTPIKEAKWEKGVKSASEVLANGTVITDKKFEVSENGVYSVAVLDTKNEQEVETIEIKNIDTTPPAPVTGLTAAYSSTGKKISVSWTNPSNLDFAGLILNYKKEGEDGKDVALGTDKTSHEITDINTDGSKYTITVKAKDDAGNQSAAAEAEVTATITAEITGITIPKAGTNYGGNKIPVRINGKNFIASGVSAADFSGSGAGIANFKIVSDTVVTAEVECPYLAGETNVTVRCGIGTEQSKTGILSVSVTESGAGKIVLADKTIKAMDEYTEIDPSNPPVGIICDSLYGAPKKMMLALHTSGSGLKWAKNGSTGYNTKFEGIICTPSKTGSGAAGEATFEGDTDGSDNWECIKSIDSEGTAEAATNYPAFNWVNMYNTTYADKLGGKTFDWYMPSLAELCAVYRSREAINASLTKIHGLDVDYAEDSLGTDWYWSSSQDSDNNSNAWNVVFGYGYVVFNAKDSSLRVCCIAGF